MDHPRRRALGGYVAGLALGAPGGLALAREAPSGGAEVSVLAGLILLAGIAFALPARVRLWAIVTVSLAAAACLGIDWRGDEGVFRQVDSGDFAGLARAIVQGGATWSAGAGMLFAALAIGCVAAGSARGPDPVAAPPRGLAGSVSLGIAAALVAAAAAVGLAFGAGWSGAAAVGLAAGASAWSCFTRPPRLDATLGAALAVCATLCWARAGLWVRVAERLPDGTWPDAFGAASEAASAPAWTLLVVPLSVFALAMARGARAGRAAHRAGHLATAAIPVALGVVGDGPLVHVAAGVQTNLAALCRGVEEATLPTVESARWAASDSTRADYELVLTVGEPNGPIVSTGRPGGPPPCVLGRLSGDPRSGRDCVWKALEHSRADHDDEVPQRCNRSGCDPTDILVVAPPAADLPGLLDTAALAGHMLTLHVAVTRGEAAREVAGLFGACRFRTLPLRWRDDREPHRWETHDVPTEPEPPAGTTLQAWVDAWDPARLVELARPTPPKRLFGVKEVAALLASDALLTGAVPADRPNGDPQSLARVAWRLRGRRGVTMPELMKLLTEEWAFPRGFDMNATLVVEGCPQPGFQAAPLRLTLVRERSSAAFAQALSGGRNPVYEVAVLEFDRGGRLAWHRSTCLPGERPPSRVGRPPP